MNNTRREFEEVIAEAFLMMLEKKEEIFIMYTVRQGWFWEPAESYESDKNCIFFIKTNGEFVPYKATDY